MTLTLLQFRDASGRRGVAARRDGGPALCVQGVETVVALATASFAAQELLETAVSRRMTGGERVDLDAVTLLPPVDHADPAHLLVSGTGLTHLGSAEQRDRMHSKLQGPQEALTDSMKMFRMGIEGGKPASGEIGVQPEWFYKGDGDAIVAPGAPLPVPGFALDAGEEPEIAGLYVIATDGTPLRLGFALGNEFSDHLTERENYLWLAHSKLRAAALGPELLVGPLPRDIRGKSRIWRDGAILWEKPFLTGEDNMSHTIENLEHHHFKYPAFRRPGDVHVHFFGTGTLSFGDGLRTQSGDVFEIEAQPFSLPLRNPIAAAAPTSRTPVQVHSL